MIGVPPPEFSGAAGYPLVGFVDDHDLDEKETLVVVAMLFQDVYAGAGE